VKPYQIFQGGRTIYGGKWYTGFDSTHYYSMELSSFVIVSLGSIETGIHDQHA
jgi:hypothetical protein